MDARQAVTAAAPLGASLFAKVVLLGLVIWTAAALARAVAGRRRAIEALRASERRYRELVESSAAFLCTHDAQGVLLSVNAAAAEALGYRAAEMVGRCGWARASSPSSPGRSSRRV